MSTVPLKLASERKPGILELSPTDLRAWLESRGEPAWRAKAIRRWLFQRGVADFQAMTDLPASLRQQLAEAFEPFETRVERQLHSADDTHKLLIRLADDKLVECVLIQDEGRRTACVSTQVGCGMACVFCASGLDGVDRNLSANEILEQLLRLRNLPAPGAAQDHSAGKPRVAKPGVDVDRLTHIVVMGMGEPLANFDNLMKALEIATSLEGLGIGARHVTISTVGIPNRIRQLADLDRQYHLAVSLHAPNESLRTQIVPTNTKTGLGAILEAADYYKEKTGRQVTFEYVLLAGVNDSRANARELGRLLQRRAALVNLIPFNEVDGLDYRRPTTETLNGFVDELRLASVSVKVRKRKGSRIDAACGQLRRQTVAGSLPAPDSAAPCSEREIADR